MGGSGNSSLNPLNFPDNKAALTKIKPVPKESRTVVAYSDGKFLQYIATIPNANPKPPLAARNKADIFTASVGRSLIVFSFTAFGTEIKTIPKRVITEPMIVNAKFVSIIYLLVIFKLI